MAFEHTQVLTVEIWGRTVGALAAGSRGSYAFEYDPAWIRSGLELSPLLMAPTPRRRIFSFPRLNEETFQGLPPMIADSAPDKFGNGIINAVLAREGVQTTHITALDRLAYVGSRAMGALTFKPDSSPNVEAGVLEMSRLVEAARNAVAGSFATENDSYESIADLIHVGTSAGGARAKAIIALDPDSGEVRAGGIPLPLGFEQWLIKFDGVGHDQQLGIGQNYGRTEYAYYLMALEAGLTMSECRMLEENGRAHFMTRRFDRPGVDGARLHMQSLCGIAALDFNLSATHDYASLFTTAHSLNIDNVAEIFRRMVFNVLASNNDDHTKNHAFLMDMSGSWLLAPAYDITFAYSPISQWTQQHLMSVNGKFENISLEDLHTVGATFEVPGYRTIVREVSEVVKNWHHYAAQAELPSERTTLINQRLQDVAVL